MPSLGRKQGLPDATQWRLAARAAAEQVDWRELEQLTDRTVDRIRIEVAAGKRVAYGWSGGKDSQVLRWLMEAAGVHDAVLGMTVGLEWPAMLRWLTDHLPPGCDIMAVPLDLPWLLRNDRMLFPKGADGTRWFRLVQHRAQRDYYYREGLDLLALGRRRKDGNYIGPPGADRYTDQHGVTRWSPIADWTHEQVFAFLHHRDLPLPPCYDWPRGYQVGTGPWPARQWTESRAHGFEECWQIDPSVIRAAAEELPAARAWMLDTGHV